MVLDDGNDPKTNRANLFSTDFTSAGAATGKHCTQVMMTVVDFAVYYSEDADKQAAAGGEAPETPEEEDNSN